MQNLKISKELFIALLRYFFGNDSDQRSYIEKELKQKLNCMAAHDRYTKKLKDKSLLN